MNSLLWVFLFGTVGLIAYHLVLRTAWYGRYHDWVYRFLDRREERRKLR